MPDKATDRFKQLQMEATDALDDARLAQRSEHQISRLQHVIHFWTLVVRSFIRNRCPVRASSLAYASLLALVPVLAVVIGVSASFLQSQGEEPIQRFIDTMVRRLTPSTNANVPFFKPRVAFSEATNAARDTNAPAGTPILAPGGALLDPQEYERTRGEMVKKIQEFVANTQRQSATLGATGMVALLFVAISMLSRSEDTFNDIWGVTRGRTWFARIVQYWGAITLGPVVLGVTLTMTSSPYLSATRDFVASHGVVGALSVKVAMALLPYVIWSLAFALFYQLMPNTRVEWQAALVGGVIGGCLWQLNSQFSVLYVSQVVSNSRVYGSLGMIPVLMIGLYFGWLILLFGAQIAYAWQNRRAYLQERQAEGVHQRSREFVALRLATQLGIRFLRGEPPPTLPELTDLSGVPSRLASQVLEALIAAGLVVEIQQRSQLAYAPGRPLDRISAQDIMQALRSGRGIDLGTREDGVRNRVSAAFEQIGAAEKDVASGIKLQQLAVEAALTPAVEKAGSATG